MTDNAPSPAPLSDQELRETLDMLGTVVASVSDRVDNQTDAMNGLIKTATEALKKAEESKWETFREIRERENALSRFKSRLPWFGLGAVVLALAMTVMLPRFLAGNVTTCTVLGASWTATTTGVDACVFYQR